MNETESFETTEYGDSSPISVTERLSTIAQISVDKVKENPTFGCRIVIEGNCLKIFFNSYEMHLPRRIKEVQDRGEQSLREMVKYLKKEFKSRTKKTLNLKELKDRANYAAQKVSLNERYLYSAWKYYEFS